MARVAKGGYIKNGKTHHYRALIMDADKWAHDKAGFLRTLYGCTTKIFTTAQGIELKAHRKAEGRKKEINLVFFLEIIENPES